MKYCATNIDLDIACHRTLYTVCMFTDYLSNVIVLSGQFSRPFYFDRLCDNTDVKLSVQVDPLTDTSIMTRNSDQKTIHLHSTCHTLPPHLSSPLSTLHIPLQSPRTVWDSITTVWAQSIMSPLVFCKSLVDSRASQLISLIVPLCWLVLATKGLYTKWRDFRGAKQWVYWRMGLLSHLTIRANIAGLLDNWVIALLHSG